MATLSKYLRELREEAKLTQTELAKRAKLDRSLINRLEKEDQPNTRPETLRKILAAFKKPEGSPAYVEVFALHSASQALANVSPAKRAAMSVKIGARIQERSEDEVSLIMAYRNLTGPQRELVDHLVSAPAALNGIQEMLAGLHQTHRKV